QGWSAFFKERHIAAFGNEQTNRFVGALIVEILFQPLAQPARMGTNNSVDRRIVVRRAIEQGLADIDFVDSVSAAVQREIADIDQKTAKPGRLDESAGTDNALDQFPAGVRRKRRAGLKLSCVVAHVLS